MFIDFDLPKKCNVICQYSLFLEEKTLIFNHFNQKLFLSMLIASNFHHLHLISKQIFVLKGNFIHFLSREFTEKELWVLRKFKKFYILEWISYISFTGNLLKRHLKQKLCLSTLIAPNFHHFHLNLYFERECTEKALRNLEKLIIFIKKYYIFYIQCLSTLIAKNYHRLYVICKHNICFWVLWALGKLSK